ncbi:MAG TPA: hypothetical protein VND64_08645 [Pirellulales bacterium]|nr:hypothetical protein [Pirellulales bacterium]
MRDFEERLAAIERGSGRWKWTAVVLGVSLLTVTAAAAEKPETTIPDVIYARKFVAVNEANQPVAYMGHQNNLGMLCVVDPDGTLLFVASCTRSGQGMLCTFDADGSNLVTVGAKRNGEGHVTVHDRQGNDAARRTSAMSVSTAAKQPSP